MCQCGRVDDNEIGTITHGPLHPVDQLMLSIALKDTQCYRCCLRFDRQIPVNIFQCCLPVDGGFSSAQKIQIGAMDHQDICSHIDHSFTMANYVLFS